MMTGISLNKNKVLILFLYLSIIIDFFTGVVKLKDPDSLDNSPIGVLFKGILIVLLLSYALKINKIVFLSVILIAIQTFMATINDSIFAYLTNLISSFKLLLFILIFYTLYYLVKRSIINAKTLFNIALFTFCALIINQLLGLIGYGKATYSFGENRIGTTGFFFESNAYSYIFLILSIIVYLQIGKRIKYKWRIAYFGLCLLIAITIAMKLAIAGTLLMVIVFLWKKNKKLIILFVVLLLGLFFVFQNIIVESKQMLYYIEHFSENNINESMLSGRDSRLETNIVLYFHKFTFFEQLFGIGRNRVLNDNLFHGTSEMDYIDILKSNGIIGFIIVYASFLWICISHIYMYMKSKINEFRIVLFFNLIILIASCLSGHLFTSGSSPIYLAILNIYPYALYFEKYNSNRNEIQSNNLNIEVK